MWRFFCRPNLHKKIIDKNGLFDILITVIITIIKNSKRYAIWQTMKINIL